jgi:MFS family permease
MKIGLNKVIRTLILSDFLLQSGWGLIGPIFAIFITKQIHGGSLAMVGLIVATYWIIKSIIQPFIARYMDIKRGEKDDLNYLFMGLIIANLVPLGYVFVSDIWHIFLLETIRGMAMAFAVPSWAAIFTRHIDRGWEAFSWSIHSTSFGLASGFAAAFGGIIATFLGFKTVFILVSLFGLASSLILFFIRDQMYTKDGFSPLIPPPEKKLQ